MYYISVDGISAIIYVTPTVLYLQHQHRPTATWKKITQLYWRFDAAIICMDGGRMITWGYTCIFRLHGVFRLRTVRIDHAIGTTLVERWRQESHTFDLLVSEVTVSFQDVCPSGLRIDGRLSLATQRILTYHFLRVNVSYAWYAFTWRGRIKFKVAKEHFRDGPPSIRMSVYFDRWECHISRWIKVWRLLVHIVSASNLRWSALFHGVVPF